MIILEKTVNNRSFKLVNGSIIDEPVDAIVNPANENLSHGGGLAGLIVKTGGVKIQEESYKKAPVRTGSAVFTGAGKLKFKYIIHSVGPIYRGGHNNEAVLLASAVLSALKVADNLSLKSISMPPISTGIFGYPVEPAIRIISETIFDYMKNESSLKEIRLCEFNSVKAEQIKNIIEK